MLHRPYKNEEQKQNVENIEEVSNLSSVRSSGVLPVIPVTIGSESKTLKAFALCDSGARLSFVDESLMKTLNLTGQPVDLNVAGIHGKSDISSKRLRVKIGDQDGKVNEYIMAYSHPHVNAGTRSYDLKKLKETYPHLSVLKDSTVNLGDVKVILGQDCYHLHRAIGYRKCGKSKPWAVLAELGWMLSGPLPQQETEKLESFAIKSNIRTLEEFSVKLDLLRENIDVASVRRQVEEKQPTQMQAVKFAAKTLTLEEEKKCSQMNKVVEFVKGCQVELNENSRGKAMYRRHSSDLLERNQPYNNNASDGAKAVEMSFWRKHDVELEEKLLDKIMSAGPVVNFVELHCSFHKLNLKKKSICYRHDHVVLTHRVFSYSSNVIPATLIAT